MIYDITYCGVPLTIEADYRPESEDDHEGFDIHSVKVDGKWEVFFMVSDECYKAYEYILLKHRREELESMKIDARIPLDKAA